MDEIRRGLEILQSGNPLVELRPKLRHENGYHRGLFDDHGKLYQAIRDLNELEADAVYWTLNALRDMPATNKLVRALRGGCVGNDDVTRIRWLFLDLDGTEAKQLSDDIVTHLGGKGWEPPVRMFSGGGYYLFYKVDLDPDQCHVLRGVVRHLKSLFDRPGAKIDPVCLNPGRIARVPGTWHRKDEPVLARITEVAA